MKALLRLLLVSCLLMTHVQSATTVLTWHNAQAAQQLAGPIKQLFVPFFQSMYAHLTEADLCLAGKFATKADWLTTVANNLANDLQDPAKNLYLVTASTNNNLVGFAVFNHTATPGMMHLKQFALSDTAPDLPVAQQLVDAIFAKVPTIERLIVGVRKVNTLGAALYKNLGFVPAASPENHDANIFDGLVRLGPA